MQSVPSGQGASIFPSRHPSGRDASGNGRVPLENFFINTTEPRLDFFQNNCYFIAFFESSGVCFSEKAADGTVPARSQCNRCAPEGPGIKLYKETSI